MCDEGGGRWYLRRRKIKRRAFKNKEERMRRRDRKRKRKVLQNKEESTWEQKGEHENKEESTSE